MSAIIYCLVDREIVLAEAYMIFLPDTHLVVFLMLSSEYDTHALKHQHVVGSVR